PRFAPPHRNVAPITPHVYPIPPLLCYFFFNAPATTEIYTLSLHDALPISFLVTSGGSAVAGGVTYDATNNTATFAPTANLAANTDRKSTRLNSSHGSISYAVFCLKKKRQNIHRHTLVTQHGTIMSTRDYLR